MKFKAPIEVQAGISDGDPTNPLGLAGYLLSSDGSNVSWVSPGGLSAETAETIVQPIKANEALTKGDPLYIVGFQNGQGVNIVEKADSSDPAKMPVVGIADADYSNQAFGTMTAFGSFNGNFDTTGGTENWSVGDIIFVKPGGGLTNIKPGGTDLIQNIAIVSRVQQNTGELEVIALGRTNDVPNLPEGRLFVGTAINTSLTSEVVYIDDANDRVGIGTTSPDGLLHIDGISDSKSGLVLEASNNGDNRSIDFQNTSGALRLGIEYDNASINLDVVDRNRDKLLTVRESGNVGIGTTSPGSKLQVDGEIDANGGDGYRINGKPWAAESSNILKLGDWDGEGFSTSIYDENTIEIFKVKDQGVIINCDRTSSTSYGVDASLVVGGDKFSPFGAGVVTLLNNDNASQAGDSTGIIQFAIRDDQTNFAGYTSASIKGSIDFAAGSGSSGGGILDFLTSTGALGSSPSLRMRINRSGNVGINDTTPSYKLDVNGEGRFTGDLRCLSLIQTSQSDKKESIAGIVKTKAKTIEFKEYVYKSDGANRKRYGVLAEDIEDDYPELVHVDAEGVKGINYIDLLVKRVAELEKELEDISLTQGPKGDAGSQGLTGASGPQGKAGINGANGADGNSHLSNISSMAINSKTRQLEITIGKSTYKFNPDK